MAAVYRAENLETGREVALKRPMPWEGCNERLRREADSLASIGHAHVMPVIDTGTDSDGNHWYAMPIAVGSLDSLWTKGFLGTDAESLCRVLLDEAGGGIGAFHDAGLIHRDLKPGNVLALADRKSSSGIRWVVADLGLVRRRLGQTTQNLTGSASMVGTLGYIAPEVTLRARLLRS